MTQSIDDVFESFRPKIDHHIATSGVSIQGVFASGTEPMYLYTIGLHGRHPSHPEILISGMGHMAAHAALMACHARIAAGATLPLETPIDDILREAGVPMQLRRVHAFNSAWFGMALRYYRSPVDFAALQLFWLDPVSGAWPWEQGKHGYRQHRLDLPSLATN